MPVGSQGYSQSRGRHAKRNNCPDDDKINISIQGQASGVNSKEVLIQYLMNAEAKNKPMRELDIRKTLGFDVLDMKNTKFMAETDLEEIVTNEGKLFLANRLVGIPEEASTDLREDAKRGFLLVVLTAIFMARDPTIEESNVDYKTMKEILNGLGIDIEGKDPFLGDVERLIGPSKLPEFVSSGWITCEAILTTEGDDYIYDWGPKAEACVKRMDILKFFCDLIGETNIEAWESHYNRASVKTE